jgi:ornithine--oxo-acid transaminase
MSDGLIGRGEAAILPTYPERPLALVRGAGCTVWDEQDRPYLDFVAGLAVCSLGHGHPAPAAALAAQAFRLGHVSNLFWSEPSIALAERLHTLAGFGRVFFCNSGAEALEAGIKLARRRGGQRGGAGKHEIVCLERAFHGRTLATLAAGGSAAKRDPFAPVPAGFLHVPANDLEALRAAIGPQTAAVLLEPVQGEGGVVIPPEGYLRAVRAICDEAGALMIADEIQSGLARTGRTFACDHESVTPDMYILGKALGGGLYPVSAVAANRDVLGVITPGTHGSTFGGNPLAAAIGSEVVAMLQTGEFQERAAKLGEQLYDGLAGLVGHGIDAVRARGLWAGIDIATDKMTGREFPESLLGQGILAKEAHGQTVRLAPPIVASDSDIDLLVSSFRQVLTA